MQDYFSLLVSPSHSPSWMAVLPLSHPVIHHPRLIDSMVCPSHCLSDLRIMGWLLAYLHRAIRVRYPGLNASFSPLPTPDSLVCTCFSRQRTRGFPGPLAGFLFSGNAVVVSFGNWGTSKQGIGMAGSPVSPGLSDVVFLRGGVRRKPVLVSDGRKFLVLSQGPVYPGRLVWRAGGADTVAGIVTLPELSYRNCHSEEAVETAAFGSLSYSVGTSPLVLVPLGQIR